MNTDDSTEFRKAFGQRMSEELDRLGLTQREMAALAGQGPVSGYRYINGKALPGAEVLHRLAAGGFDVAFLLTGNTRAPRPPARHMALVAAYDAAPLAIRRAVDKLLEQPEPARAKPAAKG